MSRFLWFTVYLCDAHCTMYMYGSQQPGRTRSHAAVAERLGLQPRNGTWHRILAQRARRFAKDFEHVVVS